MQLDTFLSIHKAEVQKVKWGGGAVCGLRIITSRKEDLGVTSPQISMK